MQQLFFKQTVSGEKKLGVLAGPGGMQMRFNNVPMGLFGYPAKLIDAVLAALSAEEEFKAFPFVISAFEGSVSFKEGKIELTIYSVLSGDRTFFIPLEKEEVERIIKIMESFWFD